MNREIANDFVAVATKQCQICGKLHTHNTEVLIHKQLKSIGDKTFTGEGLCKEHAELHEDGYVALVAIDEDMSTVLDNGNYVQEGAHRTGKIAHLRREVFNDIFNTEVAPELPMVFVSDEVIDMLVDMQETVH